MASPLLKPQFLALCLLVSFRGNFIPLPTEITPGDACRECAMCLHGEGIRIAVEDFFDDISRLSKDESHDKDRSLVCFLCGGAKVGREEQTP